MMYTEYYTNNNIWIKR